MSKENLVYKETSVLQLEARPMFIHRSPETYTLCFEECARLKR